MSHAQKPDFVFRAKRTSPFKSVGGLQFSRLLAARGVRISGSNAGYTMLPCSVKSTPFASFPFTSRPVRNRVPSHFNWNLLTMIPHSITCFTYKIFCKIHSNVGRENAGGIVTRYGTDGPGIESRRVSSFFRPARSSVAVLTELPGPHFESRYSI